MLRGRISCRVRGRNDEGKMRELLRDGVGVGSGWCPQRAVSS